MGEEAIEKISENRYASYILIFFAAFGFFASLVTIIEYLRPADALSLNVSVNQHDFRVPLYVAESLQQGASAREVVDDLRRISCKDIDETIVVAASPADLLKMDVENGNKTVTQCRDMIDIEFVSRWAGETSKRNSAMLEYTIKNDGAKTAQDIRIEAQDIASLQYERGRDFISAEKSSDGDHYVLPNLNPNETLNILTWMNGSPRDISYSDWNDFPKVTFSGHQVNMELYKPVPDSWYSIYDFLSSAPLILSTFFVIAISILIVLAMYLFIGLIISIFTGHKLSKVLEIKASTEDP